VTVRQHAQQPRLQLCRHVADFVEEQRPPFGLFEPSLSLRRSSGKGAAFVAEQLGLQQVAREWPRC
jgi:hypothetical protein